MPRLIIALLVSTSVLAPVAWAQAAGSSIPRSALDGQIKNPAAKKRVVVKKRAPRPAVRKAVAPRSLHKGKAKAPAPKAPAKQAEVPGLTRA